MRNSTLDESLTPRRWPEDTPLSRHLHRRLGFHGNDLFLTFLNEDKAYFLSIGKKGALPKIPEQGLRDSAELTGVAGVTAEPYSVESAISPDLYSYTRTTYRRNLYRIPLP